MENIFITTINIYLTKRNIYKVQSELIKIYEKRKEISLYPLQDLKKDFQSLNKFMAANTRNFNLYIFTKIICDNQKIIANLKRMITNKIKSL